MFRPRLLDTSLKILDGKLPWGSEALVHGGYVIFWLQDRIAKFKFAKWKSPNLMPANFSRYTVINNPSN